MTSGNNQESFLTVAEVAEILKLNQQTVRNWIDAGSMPAVKIGRRVRIKQSDLERIVEAGYAPGSLRGPGGRDAGPSAQDFWNGETVGEAEPDPAVVALRGAASTRTPTIRTPGSVPTPATTPASAPAAARPSRPSAPAPRPELAGAVDVVPPQRGSDEA